MVRKIVGTKAWRLAALSAFAATTAMVAGPSSANHSWGGYHWARASGTQVTARVGDNVDSRWDAYLRQAVVDWNKSTVIEGTLVAGMTSPRTCKPVAGRIEVCNSAYGQTGWLGIAQIWLSNGHISQGVTKLNDTYYALAQYNTPAWRAAVTCQEIGHDYGLGHQDEDFSTDATTSCMEYTNNPVGNEHPDSHDYNQLLAIYNHAESTATTAASRTAPSAAEGGNGPSEWGTVIGHDAHGRPNRYMHKQGDLTKITHVTWAPTAGNRTKNGPTDGHDEDDGHTH
jgi:hypothetical protein